MNMFLLYWDFPFLSCFFGKLYCWKSTFLFLLHYSSFLIANIKNENHGNISFQMSFFFLFLFLLWNFLDLFKDQINCWRNRNNEHVQSYLYLHEIWRKKKKYSIIEMKEEQFSQRIFFFNYLVFLYKKGIFSKRKGKSASPPSSSSHRCDFCVFNNFTVFLWQGLPGLLLNIYKLSVFIKFCNRESHSNYIALGKITFFSFLWTFLFLATFSTS